MSLNTYQREKSVTQIHPLTKMRMVCLRAGSFDMGCATGGIPERPVHRVSLPEFWVDENPVTNSAYSRFCAETGYRTEAELKGEGWGSINGKFQMIPALCWKSYAADRGDHPVVLVSWNDAIAYSEWAGLRLMTEAEWEYCARGGADGFNFPWGEEEPDGTQSNFARTVADVPPTNPVGLMGVNRFGIADLVGNVWQWCHDYYSDDYYSLSPKFNPNGPNSGELRVRRGGAWNVIQGFRLRCSNRGAARPETVAPNIGFRCSSSSCPSVLE